MDRFTAREEKSGNVFYPHCFEQCQGMAETEQGINCEYYDKLLKKFAEYEDLEEQGLLQRIECRCKDCVHWSDMVAGATEYVKLCTIGGYMVGENGYCVYGERKV